jgi:elongation factor P
MATMEVKLGMYILYEGEPYVIVDKEFCSPGKGGAFNRVKMKNLKTGKIISRVFDSDTKLDDISVLSRSVQYLYVDGTEVYFMDQETYDQFAFPLDLIPGGTGYLHADSKYIASFYEDEVLAIQIPIKMTLEVKETSGAVKGNTATNAFKDAIVETGAKIQVPLFINQGDKIIINTDTGTYVAKA